MCLWCQAAVKVVNPSSSVILDYLSWIKNLKYTSNNFFPSWFMFKCPFSDQFGFNDLFDAIKTGWNVMTAFSLLLMSIFICRKVWTWRPQKEVGWDEGEPSKKKNEWVVVHAEVASTYTTEWTRRENQSVFQLYHWVVQVSAHCPHVVSNYILNNKDLLVVTGTELVFLFAFPVFFLIDLSLLVWFLRLCHSESRKLFPKYPSLIRYVQAS